MKLEFTFAFLELFKNVILCPSKGRLDLLTNRQGAMYSAAKKIPGLTVIRLFFVPLAC